MSKMRKTSKSGRQVNIFPSVRAAQHYKFKLSRHGLRRKYWHKYHFSCKVRKCDSTFNSVKEWNAHHTLVHPCKSYMCNTCGKVCDTPVSYKDHIYFHRIKGYSCSRCNKSFINQSHLNLHKHIHR